MNQPVVYDKAKYHFESVEEHGLAEEQAYVPTAFFFGWLMAHDLMSAESLEDCAKQVEEFKARAITPHPIYEWWDCCLVDDMLSDEGNAFAQAYFDFETGRYLADYSEVLVKELPSEFHVEFNWANYDAMAARIDHRYAEWRAGGDKRDSNATASSGASKQAWWRRMLLWKD